MSNFGFWFYSPTGRLCCNLDSRRIHRGLFFHLIPPARPQRGSPGRQHVDGDQQGNIFSPDQPRSLWSPSLDLENASPGNQNATTPLTNLICNDIIRLFFFSRIVWLMNVIITVQRQWRWSWRWRWRGQHWKCTNDHIMCLASDQLRRQCNRVVPRPVNLWVHRLHLKGSKVRQGTSLG